MKLTQTYSRRISPDSSSDGCSLPASTRTVGSTLSTGTTRVTHGDMYQKNLSKSFLFLYIATNFHLSMELIPRLWHVYQTPKLVGGCIL